MVLIVCFFLQAGVAETPAPQGVSEELPVEARQSRDVDVKSQVAPVSRKGTVPYFLCIANYFTMCTTAPCIFSDFLWRKYNVLEIVLTPEYQAPKAQSVQRFNA